MRQFLRSQQKLLQNDNLSYMYAQNKINAKQKKKKL